MGSNDNNNDKSSSKDINIDIENVRLMNNIT